MPTPDKTIGEFIKPPKIIKQQVKKSNANDINLINESSSDSSEHGTIVYGERLQEHARPRIRMPAVSASQYSAFDSGNRSSTSLSSSITRFRNDFDQLKCKMKIFGETVNLCHCLADDFKKKLVLMEKRLESLEKRQHLMRTPSNYSAIIQKNKLLSFKTLKGAKKLQMCGTEEEMREVAARICRNYLHGSWKTVDPKELDFKRINGGLSNFLYYVALPDDVTKLGGYVQRESSPDTEDPSKLSVIKKTGSVTYCAIEEPKKVLLRIYGQVHGERAMDAIVTESVVFTLLSERRLGPKLHGVFSGGRIEEYIPARPLLAQELADPALSMKIAEKMAAIHSMDVPLNKEPNYIWKTMGKWLKTVKEERLSPTTQGKNEEEQRMIKTLKAVDFDKEIEWLKKFLATLESPVVFCHNDMQEGNILLLEDNAQTSTDEEISSLFLHSYDSDQDKKDAYEISQFEDANTSDTIISRSSDIGEPKLVFIDFEYCAYNYRGFDIANHFQEWAYDYTNPEHPFYYENQDFCPNLEQKEIFIKQYLKHYTPNSQDDKKTDASLDDVNKLLDEVEAFACASHLFWTLWSIVNASKSQIPFGYWEYAISRLETYQRVKQEAIKKSQGLPQKRKICEVDI